jgi:hypothetical protein
MVLAPFVNYNMDAIFPFCAEAAQYPSRIKVFVSSKTVELRDMREMLGQHLDERGIDTWIYESNSVIHPDNSQTASLSEVDAADLFIGLFWKKYNDVTVQEFRHARRLKKPCFIYVQDQNTKREQELENFLAAEVLDVAAGVTSVYFDKESLLLEQVADDIYNWLRQRHIDATSVIQMARVSQDEISRLQTEVKRFQDASRQKLPRGTKTDYLAHQLKGWFQSLGYRFESYEVYDPTYFEWIVNIPARRGYDRVLVRGISGEAGLRQLSALRNSTQQNKADEGWLVASRRVSQAARDAANNKENQDVFCYTLDELIDEFANFNGYLEWLETKIKEQKIDTMYVPLAAKKDEIDPETKRQIGHSIYDENNGWIEGYIDRWLDDPSKEHISILGEFGTGKTWFALHYAWLSLQKYKVAKEKGVQRPRLPLVIPLRDYAKAVSVESLFSEFFFRKHEIPLSGYSVFEQLNRMGKFLLIFDGFDEMATRVDRQKMIDNFWELARVVVPGSKAILTCRTEHFPTSIEGRSLLNAELKASTANLSGDPPQFEVLELEKFNNKQIYQVLLNRTPHSTVLKVMENPQLLDLVRLFRLR